MNYSLFNKVLSKEVISLFTAVFSESEGEAEGQLIGNLVIDLIANTPTHDLIGFVAEEGEQITGSIFFSRFYLPDDQVAFMLSPVAVATNQQGKGIGQQLIRYGLEYLKRQQVSLVLTYGDPKFYSKVGFQQISENQIKPPFKLSQPEGWLAQPLNDDLIKPVTGDTQCVEAFNHQAYW